MLRISAILVLVAASLAAVAAQQYDILPGVETLGRGWIPMEDRFGRPVVELKWNRRAWIRSPYDDQRYSVPDCLANGGIRTSQAFYKYENEVYSNTVEYVNAKGNEFGIGFKVPSLFEFSTSRINRRMNAFLNTTEHRYGVTGERHQYFAIKAPPPEIFSMDLSEEFQTMLGLTNWVFNDATQKRWWTIFEYYGTHYASNFDLGGEVHMETMIDGKRIRTEDVSYIKKQLTISLGASTTPNSPALSTPTAANDPTLGMVPGLEIPVLTIDQPNSKRSNMTSIATKSNRAALNRRAALADGPFSIGGISWGLSFSTVKEEYRKQLTDEFTSASKATIHLVGGEHYGMEPDQWRDWIPTIIKSPEVISKKLIPIETLFDDPKKQAVFKQAADAYQKWWVATGQYNRQITDPWGQV